MLPILLAINNWRCTARSTDLARFLFLLCSCFIIPTVSAIEAVTVSVEEIKTQGWRLQGAAISLTGIEKKAPQLQLSIQKLFLPKPFDDLKLLQVQCSQFDWGNNEIHCTQGNAQLQSKSFSAPRFKFSFHISQKQSQFQIQQLKLLAGVFDLQGTAQRNNWQLNLNGKQIGLAVLHKLLFPQLKLGSGTVNLNAHAEGNRQGLSKFKLQAQTNNLTLQTKDGTKACEALTLNFNLSANKNQQKRWLWKSENLFQQGSFYIEPLYLENKNILPISLSAQGYWDETRQQLEFTKARFHHPGVGVITANGLINREPKLQIQDAHFELNIPNLEPASAVYLSPYLSATTLEGILLLGELKAGITVKQQAVTEANLTSQSFGIKDKKQRFDLQAGIAALNWSDRDSFNKNSLLFWKKFNVFGVPLEQSYFVFLLKQKKINLQNRTIVPVLGGEIQIHQFDWQAVKNQSPKVHFAGEIKRVSLQQLSKALDWHPLPGNISGQVPSVNFTDGKLTLEGGLKINVFDGEININKLALSGLMTDFSQFESDIEINNLDLDLLTQQFSFGGMQGRVSGYVRSLYMENWQPVTFYAWIGTPEGDNSTHQISQKAVQNIASIGGGGVVDLFSRLVLSVFDNFSYEKLGLGCYLHNGVCQLMGVEVADVGYYIVKGGGLPRIDVMGYNPRIDWSVLQERLKRIKESSSEAVIEE